MITVAIVAILAALAYPSYRNYVIRGQIVDATNGLSAMRANMERYYQDNRTYAAANGYQPPCLTPATVGNFTVSCPTAPTAATMALPSYYQIKAIGSSQEAGFTYTVDSTPVMTTSIGAAAPSAWQISCPQTWSTKPGQC